VNLLDGDVDHDDLQQLQPNGKLYSLRLGQRAHCAINYAISPVLEKMKQAKPLRPAGGGSN
jgi:hypothetical protein